MLLRYSGALTDAPCGALRPAPECPAK
ncbi:hypothetical protein CBM2599_A180082 [Cupriavidus taiwanensis]|nr:hypothetical protein CBM2599_A180082 [Cupriavidus taiwanensis]SOY86835.1 hypothetical protein CBM2600_A160084 [Cupriavidus taiwanensis]